MSIMSCRLEHNTLVRNNAGLARISFAHCWTRVEFEQLSTSKML